MGFDKEQTFEENLIEVLKTKGWDKEVLRYKTEKELIQNWANILYDNNRSVDRLNNYPLTDSEMQQILEQIISARTPLHLNNFINGKSITITRDNPDDIDHIGKQVSLKIYDRMEIAAGQSRYQIVEQPQFPTVDNIQHDYRGDLMLLINGMPVIHIELKKSGVPVSKAVEQIKKYSRNGVFTGLFSLVQIFVAMNPEEMKYFANPGPDGSFNDNYMFHWGNFDNEPIGNWKDIATKFLSIPMAHQLIGFYTVPDSTDGILKVMRSYQYYAASAISDKVARTDWTSGKNLGGFIWHTTGSGKTMTSFKSAQLIANSKDADKVVFLVDRIELGTQSLGEFKNFADDSESVQGTEDTNALIGKLKSSDPADTLIVTSIQKMSNIYEGGEHINTKDVEHISRKRLVFIIDECHRSTFGDMLIVIKNTWPQALFFGFTGTPIQDENQKHDANTAMIFGKELHRYSIADGIRDKNVLAFDPYMVMTFDEQDMRLKIALDQAKAKDIDEALNDDKKKQIYMRFMHDVDMAGHIGADGIYVKGIEDYIPNGQYDIDQHRTQVVNHIVKGWKILSMNEFHAIFATNSINEAMKYYRLFKKIAPNLKVTALFDPSIDNKDGQSYKEDGLIEIIKDYNDRYEQKFRLADFSKMKKDIAARLAHKFQYKAIDKDRDKQIDILIVVDQMLTGFDSKWINTLYLDKMLEYENIIQAFSRTNRLFGPDKPNGVIKYYRKPYTMKANIERAVKLYSGDRPLALFVQRLPENIEKINGYLRDIKKVYASAGIKDMSRLPEDNADIGKFASLFKKLSDHYDAARMQGFSLNKKKYDIEDEETKQIVSVVSELDETTYYTLLQRYKEIPQGPGPGPNPGTSIDIDSNIIEIDTEKIDSDFMNSKFIKFCKLKKYNPEDIEAIRMAREELLETFATLSQEKQKYANLFLHDIENGDALPNEEMIISDKISEYEVSAKDKQRAQLADAFGLDRFMLNSIMDAHVSEQNIDEFGRFTKLKKSVKTDIAKEYFERKENTKIPIFKVSIKVDALLRSFIISGGFDI